MDSKKFFETYVAGNKFCLNQGMTHKVEKPGLVHVSMTTSEDHVSANDTKAGVAMIHGGVLTGLLDSALGAAALSVSVEQDMLCATAEIKTSFFAPVELGDELVATARIKHAGRRLLYAEGDVVRRSDQRVVAAATGTFNMYPLSKRM